MNFAEDVLKNTVGDTKKLALKGPEHQITYQDLRSKVTNFSWGLKQRGLEGHRIGVYMPNSSKFAPLFYAILLTGNVFVPLDPSYKEELQYLLTDSDTKAIITTKGFAERARRYSAGVDNCEHVITLTELERNTNKGITELCTKNKDAAQPYTSGTTGEPKGVVLSHQDFHSLVEVISDNFKKYTTNPKVLAPLPLFHMYGLTMSLNVPILHGGEIHVLPEWDAEQAIELIASEKLELLPGVPTMYRDLLEVDTISQAKIGSLNTCISRGSKLPHEILQEFKEKYGIIILEGFGMTETVKNPIHNTKGDYKFGSVGKEMVSGTVRLVTDNGNRVGIDEIGHLQLHESIVMDRYYQKPKETENTFTDDGWFKTDDLMRKDEDGFYFFTGRQDDVIVTGGRNVYPGEIERVIKDMEGVEDCAVVSMPDERKQKTVKAVIVPQDGCSIEPEKVKEVCLERLAPYKHPRKVEVQSELPRTPLGKIQRGMLAETDN
jgi:long-chain acyl-CoA synthetase